MLNIWLDTLVIVPFPLLLLTPTPIFRSLQRDKMKKTDGHIHWSVLGHPSNEEMLSQNFSDDSLRRNALRKILFWRSFSSASKNTYWGGTVVIVSHCKHASLSPPHVITAARSVEHARHYDSMQQASACTSSFIDLSMCIYPCELASSKYTKFRKWATSRVLSSFSGIWVIFGIS